MPWKSFPLTLSNDSSILLRSSPGRPPVLQKCTYSGPSDHFLLERGSNTVKLEFEDEAHGGSAFLTYFVGDFIKTLVLWLSMKPEAGVEIRFGIFDADPQLDHDMLKKFSQEEIKPETVGLGKELRWKFKDNQGQMREITMVIDIASTDRQFEAQLNIREPNTASTDDSQPIRASYKLTGTVVGTLKFDRVHEDVVISSLISAGVDGFDQDTTYEGILGTGIEVIAPASWEFIRGVLWNDDPACDFFNDFNSSNGDFQAWAGLWWFNYRTPNTITHRSHHGDLQFLHAMASTVNEQPEETQRKIMLWLEIMYKLSVGDGIQETDQIDSTGLNEFFNDTTTPKGSQTLRDLLVGTTPRAWDTNIKRRALGTCLHVIQDSYAVGHCQRGLINPNDMIDVEYTNYWHSSLWFPWKEKIYIKGFTKENPGRFSSIKTFHCYDGQDEDKHEYYDSIPNGEKLKPSDPTSFYCIVGANDALDACIPLATAWKKGWPWEGNVSMMMKQTFELASDATTSDIKVDEYLWGLKKS